MKISTMKTNVVKNTVMLYLLSAAKILFPFITLPYLTRVFSVEVYGIVAYTKSIMQYMQIVIDFGFMLSGTKSIVKVRDNKEELSRETSDILAARLILVGLSLIVTLTITYSIPILKGYELFSTLMYANVALTIFLFDYLFRGLEKMQVITKRFVIMKAISTLLTFVLIHDDSDIYLIPVLDITGSLVAILWIMDEIKTLGIQIGFSTFPRAWNKLRESAVYFISSMATTAFGALNTFLIGVFMSAADIAYWSVCMQIIGGIQSMYSPIVDGIYPEMMKKASFRMIMKCLVVFMPIIIFVCTIAYVFAEVGLQIVGGKEYTAAAYVFRALIPIMAFGFPAMLLGWPALGAINKEKQVTFTTLFAAVVQISGLLFLAFVGRFELIPVAICRSISEFCLLISRTTYVIKHRMSFSK